MSSGYWASLAPIRKLAFMVAAPCTSPNSQHSIHTLTTKWQTTAHMHSTCTRSTALVNKQVLQHPRCAHKRSNRTHKHTNSQYTKAGAHNTRTGAHTPICTGVHIINTHIRTQLCTEYKSLPCVSLRTLTAAQTSIHTLKKAFTAIAHTLVQTSCVHI